MTDLSDIPHNVIIPYLYHLDYQSIVAFSQVSKRYYNLCHQEKFWQDYYSQHFPNLPLPRRITYRYYIRDYMYCNVWIWTPEGNYYLTINDENSLIGIYAGYILVRSWDDSKETILPGFKIKVIDHGRLYGEEDYVRLRSRFSSLDRMNIANYRRNNVDIFFFIKYEIISGIVNFTRMTGYDIRFEFWYSSPECKGEEEVMRLGGIKVLPEKYYYRCYRII